MVTLEIWKSLEFTDNNFQISNYGRIKSLNSKPYENKPMKEGYVRFTYKNKTYFVHRLVADLFCEKKEGMYLVDHINSLRNDNRAKNLRWVNHSINNRNMKGCNRPIIKPNIKSDVINDIYKKCFEIIALINKQKIN